MDDLRFREGATFLLRCLEYRVLLGRRDELGLALRPDEENRLEALERELAPAEEPARGDLPFLRRQDRRRAVVLPIAFRGDAGELRDGAIRDLSVGGLFVATPAPGQPGERTVLRFVDEVEGREWHFAARVVWAAEGRGMGLRFLGIPLELRLGRSRAGAPSLDAAA